ncbi:MAG: hypothetical protein ACKN9T_19140 [Candidatus Methylumidiphilus sp.]
MFGVDRIFSERNGATGLVEWFFMAREGIFGPYPSKELSTARMHEFTAKCRAANDDGGRSLKSQRNGAIESNKRKHGLSGADRIFFQRNTASGALEWFFMAREGIFGPYPSKALSTTRMQEFAAKCQAANDDGGRSLKERAAKLSLESKSSGHGTAQFFDPDKRKKGKEI